METDFFVKTVGLKKIYGDTEAVRGVDICVKKGSLCALLGPSGGGKTTILRMIAGLEQPDEGSVIIDGRRVDGIHPKDRGIGFLFQNYALFSHMSVGENIAFGLNMRKLPKDTVRNRVSELLSLIGMEGYGERFPYELSGGQKQRVAFARALASEPKLLLLDEPFAAIDAKLRMELRTWLREMIYKVGVTSIFVTHDQQEAAMVADSVIVVNNGLIEQTGAPDQVYMAPKNRFMAEFIGESVTIEDYSVFKGFSEYGSGEAIVRPEYIEAFKEDNPFFEAALPYSEEAVIEDVRFCGNRYELVLGIGKNKLMVQRALERRPINIGETMHVLIYRLLAVTDDGVRMLENETIKDHSIIHTLYHW